MPDLDMYDKIVAETLGYFMTESLTKGNLAINNYLQPEYMKYFIAVGKMACDLTQTKLYLRMKFFQFYWYKLRHRKLLKGIKRYSKRATAATVDVPKAIKIILDKFGVINYKAVFTDIYEEYYAIK